MKTLLRVTRYLVSLLISLHIVTLRGTVRVADRKCASRAKRIAVAQSGLDAARRMVEYAKVTVREFKDSHIIAVNNAKNTRIAADAEAKFHGRSL